jgi:hypothetical protein
MSERSCSPSPLGLGCCSSAARDRGCIGRLARWLSSSAVSQANPAQFPAPCEQRGPELVRGHNCRGGTRYGSVAASPTGHRGRRLPDRSLRALWRGLGGCLCRRHRRRLRCHPTRRNRAWQGSSGDFDLSGSHRGSGFRDEGVRCALDRHVLSSPPTQIPWIHPTAEPRNATAAIQGGR